MFGLTEFTGLLGDDLAVGLAQGLTDEPLRQAIIPTFVLPFTILGMILTSLATWIAAFFGIQLKAEGPKRLFEVLMRPKILIWCLISNVLIYAGYAGWKYEKNSSRPLWLIETKNDHQDLPAFSSPPTSVPASLQVAEKSTKELQRLELLWQGDLKGGVFGGITTLGTSLFMGTTNGKMFMLDSSTGKTLHQFWVGQPVMTAPLILDEHIFIGEGVHDTHHSRYYKFNLKNGELVASAATLGHIERTATLTHLGAREALLIPAGRDGVYAVDTADMKTIWQAKVGHVDSYPITDGDAVYVGTGLEQGFDQDGTNAFALDLKTGMIRWKKALPTSSWGKPFVWQKQVCFSVGDVYKNTEYGQIACYDQKTGEELGAINLSGAVISDPILSGDQLIISDLHGVIYQIDLKNRKIDWRIKVPTQGLNYAPVVLDGDDHLILPGKDGLYVYSRKTQGLVYQWKPDQKWNFAYANVLIKDHVWYFADSKGLIRAFKPVY